MVATVAMLRSKGMMADWPHWISSTARDMAPASSNPPPMVPMPRPPAVTIILLPDVRGVEPEWLTMVARTKGSPFSNNSQAACAIIFITIGNLSIPINGYLIITRLGYRYSTSSRIVFDVYSPTSASPSMGMNRLALLE